ncbi:hypothetical protein SISNIDRAFT_338966 [Sistotremastrum niveocremeum HHB9708]|uniref:Uncharacterized protein n=2 Tax=Sistotremastraceae TaxID=3402574 RepID=A0A164XNE5_9AGAM|nr:hypothetical protein SISNIDRAFT_338966 [Sistotremastrum niveocremeum HHB9708]KZT44519.1 hypothetical protein SISSUDRAFT_25557 [Sistotremastrum suecicum HHB10207 ss-3]
MPLSFATVATVVARISTHSKSAHSDHTTHLCCSSGEAPITHEALAADHPRIKQCTLSHEELFVCDGGVDLRKLLRAARNLLYDQTVKLGGNSLVEERWSCRITRGRRADRFNVKIHYSAVPAQSTVTDPQRPVSLENAKNIPGLMSIVYRRE